MTDRATTFVGRETELASLRARLGAGTVATLVGPPGVGKTRMAMELVDAFRGELGVFACDLSFAATEDDLGRRLVEGLGIPTTGAPPRDAIDTAGRWLRERGPALVLLDDLERARAVAPDAIERVAAAAPEARWVLTSRTPLGWSREVVIEVGPLDDASAVRLFFDRAPFELAAAASPEDRRRAESVVRRLEGIPLAIELAAARIESISLEELDRRVAAPRGLWGSIDASWQLLPAELQAALAQCAVFEGGFDVEAIEAVVRVPSHPGSIADLVDRLVRKSLLRAAGGRFGMLASIADYATERLAEHPRRADVAERHRRWYLDRAGEWAEQVRTTGSTEALDRLAVESTNLAAVLRRAAAADSGLPPDRAARTALRAALALNELYALRGPAATNRRTLDEAIALGEAAETAGARVPELGRAIRARALVRRYAGDTAGALAEQERALALARRDGDRSLEAHVLGNLGNLHHLSGRTRESMSCYDEALRIDRAIGDRLHEGRVLAALGLLGLERGMLADARDQLERALTVVRSTGDRIFEAFVLGYLATAASEIGRLDDAETFYEAAHVAYGAIGNRRGQMTMTGGLGIVAHLRGDLAGARALYERTVAEARDVADRRYLGYFLSYLGRLDVEEGARDVGRARLIEALQIARETHDARYEAIIEAALAAADTLRAETDEERADAARTAERATAALVRVGDDILFRMNDVIEALAELAEAARAEPHDPAHAATLRASAARRAKSAQSSRSDDVRLAARLLASRLAGSA